eukprot:763976-Hanusia_phi.AAC.1
MIRTRRHSDVSGWLGIIRALAGWPRLGIIRGLGSRPGARHHRIGESLRRLPAINAAFRARDSPPDSFRSVTDLQHCHDHPSEAGAPLHSDPVQPYYGPGPGSSVVE